MSRRWQSHQPYVPIEPEAFLREMYGEKAEREPADETPVTWLTVPEWREQVLSDLSAYCAAVAGLATVLVTLRAIGVF